MNRAPWLEKWFRPLVIGVMVGCISLSIGALVHLFSPRWNATFFFVACVLAALEAHYSYRLIQDRSLYFGEAWKFRAKELALFVVLLKIGSYIGDRWADVWRDIRTWPDYPLNIIDPETTVAFVLVLFSWYASTLTTRALEQLDEVDESYPVAGHAAALPMHSLTTLFFWGGGTLLIVSGLTRIGLAALLNLRRPPVPGLVLNVLVYFVLGLVMLGQVRFASLRREWRVQKIGVAAELAGRWVRYSLLFIGLAALLAFLLPTDYTANLFDAISGVLEWIAIIAGWISTFFLFVFSLLFWLLSRLFRPATGDRPRFEPQQAPPSLAGSGSAAPGWLATLRTLLFFAAAFGVAAYVAYSYLRDHPEIWQALRRFRPVHALYRLWTALRRWFVRWPKAIRALLPQRAMQRRAAGAVGTASRFGWLIARSPRERVLFYYLNILGRARQKGYPRQAPQTPYEYGETLSPILPEGQEEMDHLTQAFVEARYSPHTVEMEQVRRARVDWQRIKAVLRLIKSRAPRRGDSSLRSE